MESGKRWCDGGVAMAMLDSDAIWGVRWGGGRVSIRFDGVSTLLFLFTLSLSVLPSSPLAVPLALMI